MKRILSFVILVALAICTLISALPTMAATPDGTAISSEAEFLAMSESGKYYLSNNITINFSYTTAFSGTLDGNGNKIKIAEGANVSPFKEIRGATFKNLTVEGVINILSKIPYGGIAAEGYGNFENVTARVGISAMRENSFTSVGTSQGCFIANATGTCSFIKCKNESSITVITESGSADTMGKAGFGGFIGSASSSNATISFVECSNNATMTSHEPCINVGGFVGASLNTNLSFTSCENNAFIIGTSSEAQHCGSGGFVGVVTSGSLTVKNCKNEADVQINGKLGHVGGCVGRLSNVLKLEINGFKNIRAIYNLTNHWEGVGGVVGIMSDVNQGSVGTYLFKDCINSGWVSGSMAGGIVGLDNGANGINITFERCINTSLVKTLGLAYAGGILGRTNGSLRSLTFTKCINTGEITTSDGMYGVGGIAGNIGIDNTPYDYTPVFEYCINAGAISCKTNVDTLGNVVAAGIMARNIYMPSTFRGCINLGTLTNTCTSKNLAPIAPSYNSITHNVSDCYYLSGSGGSAVWGESERSLADIRTLIADILSEGLSPEAEYYNYRNSDSEINSVGEGIDTVLAATSVTQVSNGAVQILLNIPSLVSISDKKNELIDLLGEPIGNSNGKYTAEVYEAYLTAYEKIKNSINSATDAQDINAIDVNALKAEAEAKLLTAVDIKKAELLAVLGEKIYNDDGDYTLDSYEAYSDAYLAIKNIIDAATDISVLNVLDVKALKDAAEAKLVKDTAPAPEAPDIDTPTETSDKTDTQESDTEVPKDKKCGSSIALSALALTCILGTAFIAKKKD